MVTMDGEIQQRFPGYLFLARKRLFKKRTPDYVPGIATSSQTPLCFNKSDKWLLDILLLLTYKLLSNAAEFRSVGRVLSRLVAEAFLHFSLFILVFPHFPF